MTKGDLVWIILIIFILLGVFTNPSDMIIGTAIIGLAVLMLARQTILRNWWDKPL